MKIKDNAMETETSKGNYVFAALVLAVLAALGFVVAGTIFLGGR